MDERRAPLFAYAAAVSLTVFNGCLSLLLNFDTHTSEFFSDHCGTTNTANRAQGRRHQPLRSGPIPLP